MIKELEQYFDRLWPITRSLTGEGNRETLDIIKELVPLLRTTEVKSGTAVYDWKVPPEWQISEAYIKDSKGKTIIDFKDNNLHVLGYSVAVDQTLSFAELRPHLYTLPEQPDLIPYLTSYYQERWGFCLSHNQLEGLDPNEAYTVKIDSSLDYSGSMTIGEAVIPGASTQEVLFSTYICHPSLANNELSGPLVAAFLYRELSKLELRYTYRFVFVPETIGSVYLISQHGQRWKEQLVAGFVITCIGDDGPFTYKKSRRGASLPDRIVVNLLAQTEEDYHIVDYFPSGSDERQYCSPGFNLPVGSLMRTMYGKYPEYHTSADDKSFISFEALAASVHKYQQVVDVLEYNRYYVNQAPYGEPQLGKRGLYPTLGSQKAKQHTVAVMMWLLNLADGQHDIVDIAERSGHSFTELIPVVQLLLGHGLLVGHDVPQTPIYERSPADNPV